MIARKSIREFTQRKINATLMAFRWQTNESNDFIPYSHHPYAYALGNPVSLTDPTGKCVAYVDEGCFPIEIQLPDCISSWVPYFGEEDCEPLGNAEDLYDTVVAPVVNTVKPTYDVVTNQPGARETVRRGWEYTNQHPEEFAKEFGKGFVAPFQSIYNGIVCQDTKQLGNGLVGFELMLGGARLARGLRSTSSAPDIVGETARGARDAAAITEKAVTNRPVIATKWGQAVQSLSTAALDARAAVEQGARLYRGGKLGVSEAAEAQFWSFENPLNPEYGAKYGIPPQNLPFEFVEIGRLKPGAQFITREAPGIGTNLGGGIEVVVEPGGVVLESFSTP